MEFGDFLCHRPCELWRAFASVLFGRSAGAALLVDGQPARLHCRPQLVQRGEFCDALCPEKRRTIANKTVNEFELIAKLTQSLPTNQSVVVGAGDDCAVLDLGVADKLFLFK